MTIYDAVMIGVVVLGMIWGAIRGITWQLASMASLVLGYLVAFPLSGQLAPHFPGEPIVARTLALLASYVGVSVSVFMVAWAIRATLRQWKFEAFDRHLGMILGGIEGAIVGLVATLFVVSLAPQARTPILMSSSGRVVCRVLDSIEPVLPSEIRAELSPFWGEPSNETVSEKTPPSPEPWIGMRPQEPKSSQENALNSTSESLQSLVEDGEARVGKAIAEAARKELDGANQENDRKIERR